MKKERTIRQRSIRRIIITALSFLYLFGGTSIYAEGLLPSLSETVGIAMPSFGEALHRYPDSETENEDGSVTELYTNVSETDFKAFSVYLESQGAELADYKAEKSVLTAEIRAKGASFKLHYDIKSGVTKVIYPSGTFDEWIKSAKTHFETGQKLLEAGKMDEALTEFLAIPQYSEYAPVADLLENDNNLAAAVIAAHEAKLAPFRMLGSTVVFGHYEQDNNKANGPEEIQWIVLDYDEKEHKTLLLSRYGLDALPYNAEYKAITWLECSLRRWLNENFLKSAFSAEERAAILKTAVDNSPSQGYDHWDTSGGINTHDYIFLLSYAEANRYLNVTFNGSNNTKSCVAPTVYAISRGASSSSGSQTADGKPAGRWWLRSPGFLQLSAACVESSLGDHRVDNREQVVRPAFWLNLEADIF